MTATCERPGEIVRPFSGCTIIANPAAAGVTGQVVAEIEAVVASSSLLAPDAVVRTAWTVSPGHAGQLARSAAEGCLVLAVGGDGTVGEAAQALSAPGGEGRVLGVLPAGSGNSTARSLWGDRAWREVLDLLADGADGLVQRRRIDLLRIQEQSVVSILGASTGFLAQVLTAVADVDPALTGIDRYYVAAAEVMRDMPAHPTRVIVDGVVLHDGPACSVAVGGGRFRARSFQFLPHSVLDDGLLDVSTIGALDAEGVAELTGLVPTGEHVGRSGVTYARGRRVVVESTDGRPLVAEYDGTLLSGAGPRLTVEILPGAVAVLGAADAAAG